MTAGRRWFLWAALAYAAILLSVFLGLRHLYDGSRQKLDEAMGQRLLGVARSVAALCDGQRVFLATVGDSAGQAYLNELADVCAGIQRSESLAEITLSDADFGRVLMSTSAALRAGEHYVYLELDPAAVATARRGVAAAGPCTARRPTPGRSRSLRTPRSSTIRPRAPTRSAC